MPTARARAEAATSGSARLLGWVSRRTSRGASALEPPREDPPQRRGRARRQVARFEEGAERLDADPGRLDGHAFVARRGDAQEEPATVREPPQRQGRGRQDDPDVSPGADPLVDQEDQLLGGRRVGLFPVEIEQLALGEAAEELVHVERELAGQDLLGLAAVRDVGVAPEGELGVGQAARRQGERTGEPRDQARRGAEPGPTLQLGEQLAERLRDHPRDRLARLADRPAAVSEPVRQVVGREGPQALPHHRLELRGLQRRDLAGVRPQDRVPHRRPLAQLQADAGEARRVGHARDVAAEHGAERPALRNGRPVSWNARASAASSAA